jgi:hypothetical protein
MWCLIMTNKQDIRVLKRTPRSYRLSMGGLKACKPLAQGVVGRDCCRDAMYRISTAGTACANDYAPDGAWRSRGIHSAGL